MQDKNTLINKVASKTNVKKEDIFSLADKLQTKDLSKDDDIRDFIGQVAKLTNKDVNDAKMDKLVDLIKNNKVPKDLNKMVK